MKNQRHSSGKQLPPEQELRYFKAVVRSLMIDASEVLANIELLSHGAELEEQIALLDHYLDYTQRRAEAKAAHTGLFNNHAKGADEAKSLLEPSLEKDQGEG